jgi:urea transport system substrate-binding protein
MLNSLSGTMAISEVAVKNAALMAIDEIKASGGVMGQQLVPVIQDGASDWPTFQYEGLETSKNIFYIAPPPNQQIIPAVTYLPQKGMHNMYLLGSSMSFRAARTKSRPS